jgi:hypothetical protein
MSEVRELRLEQAAALWRAVALSLMALLCLSVGGDVVRAAAPASGTVCAAAAPPRVEEPVRVLPPEWRWTPAVVSLDRMYGTRPADRD